MAGNIYIDISNGIFGKCRGLHDINVIRCATQFYGRFLSIGLHKSFCFALFLFGLMFLIDFFTLSCTTQLSWFLTPLFCFLSHEFIGRTWAAAPQGKSHPGSLRKRQDRQERQLVPIRKFFKRDVVINFITAGFFCNSGQVYPHQLRRIGVHRWRQYR